MDLPINISSGANPPTEFWTILLVLRTGGPRYDWRHVEAAKAQIARRIRSPHRVVVLSDDPRGDIPLRRGWPGWFGKLEMFDPNIRLLGGILYTDLANILGRDITLPPWDRALTPGRLLMWPDPWKGPGPYGSGLMAWVGGTVTAPFDSFLSNPVMKCSRWPLWSDQHIINYAMVGYSDDIAPLLTVKSYKIDKVKEAGEADVILFHGNPKPWDIGWATLGNPEPMPPRAGEN